MSTITSLTAAIAAPSVAQNPLFQQAPANSSASSSAQSTTISQSGAQTAQALTSPSSGQSGQGANNQSSGQPPAQPQAFGPSGSSNPPGLGGLVDVIV
jgi:hypothetical protein